VTLLGDGDGWETRMRVELLRTPVDAPSFEETVARAGAPMTQHSVMVQVSLNIKIGKDPQSRNAARGCQLKRHH
jgi:hypothetical protein